MGVKEEHDSKQTEASPRNAPVYYFEAGYGWLVLTMHHFSVKE